MPVHGSLVVFGTSAGSPAARKPVRRRTRTDALAEHRELPCGKGMLDGADSASFYMVSCFVQKSCFVQLFARLISLGLMRLEVVGMLWHLLL